MMERVGSGVTRFGLPGLALGLALAWGGTYPGGPAAAQTGGPRPTPANPGVAARPAEATKAQPVKAVGDSSGTLAFIANPTGPLQWLYLIDTKKRAFALYRIDTNKGAVKLEAARQYRWDLELDQYNNQAPEPADVEARVKALGPSNP
ncbi:MAG TPA: hypothetical protein VFF52_17700 [Isosphaeraceae bacterium]|nr:hypothetical protein [Isosphaeraceae bacterium]